MEEEKKVHPPPQRVSPSPVVPASNVLLTASSKSDHLSAVIYPP